MSEFKLNPFFFVLFAPQLYRSALDTRGKSWGPVEFHRFGSENGFGHKYICRSIELPPMITAFFDAYRNTKY